MSYTLAQVADAVGVDARTLSDWLARGIIPAQKPKGNHRRFGLRDLDRVALVSALVNTGFPASDAAKAVSVFSDERSYKRPPRAVVHRDGAKTLLIVDGDHASVVACVRPRRVRRRYVEAI